jgi:hypothetical protein
VTELDQRLHVLFGSLEDRLDPAVVEVANPAVDAVLAGLLPRRRPEVHTLNLPADVHMCACPVCHVTWVRLPDPKLYCHQRRSALGTDTLALQYNGLVVLQSYIRVYI